MWDVNFHFIFSTKCVCQVLFKKNKLTKLSEKVIYAKSYILTYKIEISI